MTTLPQTTGVRFSAPRPLAATGGMVPGTHLGHAGGAAAAAAHAGMSAGDVWRVLRANGWLIAATLVLSAILGLGANYLLNKYFKRYTATGMLQITDQRPPDPLDKSRQYYEMDTNRMSFLQRTQAQMLRWDGTVIAAIQNGPKIRETSWFKQFVEMQKQPNGTYKEVADVPKAKEDLLDRLSVSPIQDSMLITCAFQWRDPQDCKIIVEDLVNQHLSDQLQQRTSRDQQRSVDLNQLRNSLTFKYNTLADDIRRLQVDLNKEGITTQSGAGSPKEIELARLVESWARAQDDLAEAQGLLDGLTSRQAKGEWPAAVDMEVDRDPQINKLRSDLTEAEMMLAQIEPMTGAQSPRYRSAIAFRDKAQEILDTHLLERRTTIYNQLKETAEGKVGSLKTTAQNLTDRIDKMKDTLGDLDYKRMQYLAKYDEAKAIQENLQTIKNQLETINLSRTQQSLAGVDWARHPEKPDLPSFPKLPITLTVAMGLGLLLSLGLAFVREVLDTSVRSPRDIAKVGQLNLLGMIPHEDDDPQAAGVPVPMAIFQAPHSIIAEQFRQVRTRLQHAAALDTTRSILVTSPSPSDGKSTVAVNLAAGLALNGRKILLVDANFRRPELHKLFKLENESGFSSVLDSLDNFEGAVQKTQVPNLDVMTAGGKPGNATELLESQLLIDFIDKALEEYDHVIFDSGPLLFISETVALAPRVDGVVTVVRASSNSRGLLQRLRDELRKLKAEHLGVVLNAVRAQGGGYYGRNIKTYYEYQNGHAG